MDNSEGRRKILEVDLPGDNEISKDSYEPFDISKIEDITLFHHCRNELENGS